MHHQKLDRLTNFSLNTLRSLSSIGFVHPIQTAAVLRGLARISFGITIILIPFRYRFFAFSRPLPPIYRDFTDFILFASDVFLISTLFFWLLILALERRRPHLRPGFLSIPILGLSLIGLLSGLNSVDPGLSLYHSLRLVVLLLLYIYVINEIKSLDQVIPPVVILVILQSGVAIHQVLNQHSVGLASLGELELDPVSSGVSIVSAGGMRSLRAYGLADHPNILGGCLAFSLIILMSWFATSRSEWRIMASAILALGGLGLLYTYSRSAWLAGGIGLIFVGMAYLLSGKIPSFRSWLTLLGTTLIFTLPFLWSSAQVVGVRLNIRSSYALNPHENQSLGERAILNEAAIYIFTQNPLLGVGLGTFPIALRGHRPDYPFNYQPTHIVLLDVAGETGIFGAFFYILALTAPWVAIWINRHRLRPNPQLIAASGLLLGLTIISFFDYYTWLLEPGRLWQWTGWGLWAAMYGQSLKKEQYA
jgi:O-antigen ligase